MRSPPMSDRIERIGAFARLRWLLRSSPAHARKSVGVDGAETTSASVTVAVTPPAVAQGPVGARRLRTGLSVLESIDASERTTPEPIVDVHPGQKDSYCATLEKRIRRLPPKMTADVERVPPCGSDDVRATQSRPRKRRSGEARHVRSRELATAIHRLSTEIERPRMRDLQRLASPPRLSCDRDSRGYWPCPGPIYA